MKKKKMTLSREIVKYIFPATEPAIKQYEDGYLVYNFIRVYPDKLGIFIPNEVDKSNYSSAFPKSFESYFASIHEEAAYLSRLLEVTIEPNLREKLGVECVSGKVLEMEQDECGTVFRFDDLFDPRTKTDLLCRVKLEGLTDDDKIAILNSQPRFKANASINDGTEYLYWIMPISQLFKIDDKVLAAIFAFANSMRLRNGPF